MNEKYDPISKMFHWLIVVLVAIEFLVAITMPETRGQTEVRTLSELHFSFELLILGVIILRGIWAIIHLRPFVTDKSEAAIHTEPLPSAMYYALYISLIAMPILGWAWASSRSLDVVFFGLFPLPPLIIPLFSAAQLGGMHSLLSVIIAMLVLIHVVHVLYHHYIVHDETLMRMMPDRLAKKMKIGQQ